MFPTSPRPAKTSYGRKRDRSHHIGQRLPSTSLSWSVPAGGQDGLRPLLVRDGRSNSAAADTAARRSRFLRSWRGRAALSCPEPGQGQSPHGPAFKTPRQRPIWPLACGSSPARTYLDVPGDIGAAVTRRCQINSGPPASDDPEAEATSLLAESTPCPDRPHGAGGCPESQRLSIEQVHEARAARCQAGTVADPSSLTRAPDVGQRTGRSSWAAKQPTSMEQGRDPCAERPARPSFSPRRPLRRDLSATFMSRHRLLPPSSASLGPSRFVGAGVRQPHSVMRSRKCLNERTRRWRCAGLARESASSSRWVVAKRTSRAKRPGPRLAGIGRLERPGKTPDSTTHRTLTMKQRPSTS
jgi:hypothetical protein